MTKKPMTVREMSRGYGPGDLWCTPWAPHRTGQDVAIDRALETLCRRMIREIRAAGPKSAQVRALKIAANAVSRARGDWRLMRGFPSWRPEQVGR